MSCQGCSKKVELALNGIKEIFAVVTLMPLEATVSIEQHVPLKTLQETLSKAGDYRILAIGHHHPADAHQHNALSLKA
jgi:copper chaperone CopZ